MQPHSHRPEDVARVFDAQLHAAGLALEGGGHIKRTYRGAVAGLPARAELSLLVVAFDTTAGFYLTVELQTGLAARWAAGRNIPVLHRSGMHAVPDAPLGLALYAHDLGWARRLVEHPPTRDALSRVLGEVSFVKHFPDGRLVLQIQAPTRTDVPPIAQLLAYFAVVVATVMAPPAPTPARARWSDHTALVMALVTVAVLGAFAALAWGYYVLVR